MTEAQLHRQAAEYLAVALPPECVWTTFPAGGGGRVRGAMLKAAGLRAGWPDIQVLHDGKLHCLELKSKAGVVSQEQRDCHRAITRSGGEVYICRSLDDVDLALQCAGIPLRAHVNASGRGWTRAAGTGAKARA